MIASDTDSFNSQSNSLNNSFNANDEKSLSLDDEEEILQNQLGNVSFDKLLKAQEKLAKAKSINMKDTKTNKKYSYLKNKFEQINKGKAKDAPKENSALVKPNLLNQFKKKEKSIKAAYLSIDPRFENLNSRPSDKCKVKNNVSSVTSNRYSFVEDQAKEYLDKINNMKKSKDIQLNNEEIQNINYQKNKVKNYLSLLKHNKIKSEAKEKVAELKLSKKDEKEKVTQIVNEEKQLNRSVHEEKNFLKRKTKKENTKHKRKAEQF